jgi:23S rRNA (guanosine2251-2'-O)-methyltransferase
MLSDTRMRKIRTIEMDRLTPQEYKESDKLPVTVVLDNIRSLYNVGSVFRSCDAFRIEKVILCGISACPPSTEIHKTALGAEESVPWEYFQDTMDAVGALHKDDYYVYSVEQVEHSTKLQNLQLNDNRSYAIIFGNEVKGVRQDVVDACDGCIEIPQFGTKHSLNVSVTAGILIWEFTRLLRLNTDDQ